MTAALNQVRELLEAAERQAALWEAGFWVSDTQKQVIGAIRMGRARFEEWANVKRAWALAGQEPDGYAYSVGFWLSAGKIIADAVKMHAESLYDASVFAPIVNTAVQSGRDIAEGAGGALKAVTNPWPWQVKAGLAVGGVTLAAGVLGYAINALAKLGKVVRP
jgi:hypothetical protein